MAIKELAQLWQHSLEDKDFRFELKAQEVAVELAAAVAEAGITQAELAQRLGWKPARVSKVLHGATNLTLKTLFELSEALGLEFALTLTAKQQAEPVLDVQTVTCDSNVAEFFRPLRRPVRPELVTEPIAVFAG